LQGYLSPYDKPYYECGSASESPQVAYETNDAWRPLADLVQQLSSLSDLVFVCPRQFPICLLETIHQYQPECRLHVNNFYLRSLIAPSTDPYEFKLASSACLFSLSASYYDISNRERLDGTCYHREAVMRMASGLAPNLEEVTLILPLPGAALNESSLPTWWGEGWFSKD